jgi:hypothetical protein
MNDQMKKFLSDLDEYVLGSKNFEAQLGNHAKRLNALSAPPFQQNGAAKGALIGLAVAGIAGVGYLFGANKAHQNHIGHWQDKVRNSEASSSVEKVR